jgi:hypothetical protein
MASFQMTILHLSSVNTRQSFLELIANADVLRFREDFEILVTVALSWSGCEIAGANDRLTGIVFLS